MKKTRLPPEKMMTDSAPDQSSKKRAVVLLSGGLDSATVLAMAKQQGYQCHALSFIYGQRHDVELRAAIALQQKMNAASHRIIEIDLRGLGGSALTDDIEVPKDRGDDEISGGIPITYVPARNTIFLSYALAAAEVTQSEKIFIGVNSVDYSGYPDCRPEYVNAFQTMANLATKAGVEGRGVTIEAPLISLTKPQIIEAGLALGVDYGLTHSCYDPQVIQPWDYKKYMQSGGDILSTGPGNQLGVKPCGRCDSCLLRQKAFRQLNMSDPAIPSV